MPDNAQFAAAPLGLLAQVVLAVLGAAAAGVATYFAIQSAEKKKSEREIKAMCDQHANACWRELRMLQDCVTYWRAGVAAQYWSTDYGSAWSRLQNHVQALHTALSVAPLAVQDRWRWLPPAVEHLVPHVDVLMSRAVSVGDRPALDHIRAEIEARIPGLEEPVLPASIAEEVGQRRRALQAAIDASEDEKWRRLLDVAGDRIELSKALRRELEAGHLPGVLRRLRDGHAQLPEHELSAFATALVAIADSIEWWDDSFGIAVELLLMSYRRIPSERRGAWLSKVVQHTNGIAVLTVVLEDATGLSLDEQSVEALEARLKQYMQEWSTSAIPIDRGQSVRLLRFWKKHAPERADSGIKRLLGGPAGTQFDTAEIFLRPAKDRDGVVFDLATALEFATADEFAAAIEDVGMTRLATEAKPLTAAFHAAVSEAEDNRPHSEPDDP